MDPKYKNKSSTVYLTTLAISDTGFLLNLFAIWLGYLINGVITSSFTCPLVMYVSQVTCFVSVYLTVAFSVERYIAVYFPFKKLLFCTAAKAKKVVTGITALSLGLFLYAWFIAEVAEVRLNSEISQICTVAYKYHKISEIASYLDSFFTFIIPFLFITFFNAKIALKLYHKKKYGRIKTSIILRYGTQPIPKINLPVVQKRGEDIIQMIAIPIAYVDNIEVSPEYDMSKYRSQHDPKANSTLSETRITKTLLLVSVVFLCLNLPLHVLRCAQFLQVKIHNK